MGLDSLAMIWSNGKTVCGILLGYLVSCGLLDIDDKVCKYWKGFESNGKGFIRVVDVLLHQAGLKRMKKPVLLVDLKTENI